MSVAFDAPCINVSISSSIATAQHDRQVRSIKILTTAAFLKLLHQYIDVIATNMTTLTVFCLLSSIV